MLTRPSSNTIAAISTVCVGAFIASYALIVYKVGSLTHIGPGFLPVILGVALIFLGLLLLLAVRHSEEASPRPQFLSLVTATCGVVAFALTVDYLGMVPAIFLLTGLATLGDQRLSVTQLFVLAVSLCLAGIFIFLYGFGMPIKLVEWPL